MWMVKRTRKRVPGSSRPVASGDPLHPTRERAALPVGTRVAMDPNIACRICHEGRRGDVCLRPRCVALGVDLHGSLAD
jgi:threonine dehydrogenase-like Zn-dependent dehydrogenase